MRDGHGDLRCEHVLLGPQVRVVDRIEFDPALRQMDVARDLAFLAMDLEAHGRRWAARELARAYRHAGGDPGSEQLRCFYSAYWALVRAKVALIAAGTHHGGLRRRERARAERLWGLAERLCWRARGPVVIVVCGPAASGKSTLAGAPRSSLTAAGRLLGCAAQASRGGGAQRARETRALHRGLHPRCLPVVGPRGARAPGGPWWRDRRCHLPHAPRACGALCSCFAATM